MNVEGYKRNVVGVFVGYVKMKFAESLSNLS